MTPQSYAGHTASSGIALGLAHVPDRPAAVPLPRRRALDPDKEAVDAFDAVAAGLANLAETLRDSGQPEQADIMEVNGYLAQDPDLRGAALRRVAHGVPVVIAVKQAVEEYARAIAGLDDPTLAERATDVRQVGRRVLDHLHGTTSAAPDGPLVLLAEEVGAADLLELGSAVVAAASVLGGPNSHAAIVARSLGIPLLLGIDPAFLDLPEGTEVVVDAHAARIAVHPDRDQRSLALAAMDVARARRTALAAERALPCQTLDRHTVILRANIATTADAEAALRCGADGVGLLRTELPFLEAVAWPTEAQHAATLVPVLRKLQGRPVTVRTLDYADDKLPPFLSNGTAARRLGRGLPLMLARPDAFAEQFRAILTSGAGADVRILIPMVASLDELLSCRQILRATAAGLGVAPPPLGAMIELPEAVTVADELARESAFLSIGSNDLTCKLLGLDRRDPAATPALTAHPKVLRAIREVVEAAHRHRRQVSVCGDAAAHPLVTPLLVGLGCDILSAAPAALDEVRARIRRLDAESCAQAARDAVNSATVEDVWQIIEDRCLPRLP
ncbi:putative PEP-binding protein [Streptacidiphilus melanogenes]|uniref:putative PEP-binding protein n=1 Tax=Streptacidiphilus melanogenes TaxID=411235 RepID=UPI00069352F2|nr:putative PEP-binding protein [Streptacidiphilus melanogenes]